MFLTPWRKWLDNLARLAGRRQRRGRRTLKPRKPYLPLMEALEVRWVPAALTTMNQNFAAIEGQGGTFVVATFTDSTQSPPADYTGTITWGDGATSVGPGQGVNVSQNGNTYTVTGMHTYAEETAPNTTLPVGVTINESNGNDTDSGSAASTATVADAALNPHPVTITPFETLNFNGAVATFTDTGGSEPSGNYSATIVWGDGTSQAGTVTGGSGADLTVSGSHTYAEDGSMPLTVTLMDEGGQSNQANSVANVREGSFALDGVPAVTVTEGTAFSGTVATFSDPGSPDPASAFTVTVNWGDGTVENSSDNPSDVTVTGSSGSYTVTGTHTYADELNGNINVTVMEGNFFTIGPNPDRITVHEADALGTAATQPTPAATEGTAFSGNVAVFTDTGFPSNSSADFAATINWGDGTSATMGTVTGGNGSNLTVSGSHTYADEGGFTATVILTDDSPGTAAATAMNPVSVAEGDALSGTAAAITATEGTAFSGTVATFSDTDTANTSADFTATINWGDGTTATAGTVTGGNGSFTVTGQHNYNEDGSYSPVITLNDDAPGTAKATVTASAAVAEANADLSVTGQATSGPEGGATFTVATFTDTGSPDGSGAFSASINWGDGTVTAGTVTGSGGSYTVMGNHSYADESTNTGTVTVVETGVANSTRSATFTATATEADTPAPVFASGSDTVTENAGFVVVTPPFTNSGYPGNSASDFTATIDWGDGTVTSGNVLGGKGSPLAVFGGHTYADEGVYTAHFVLSEDAPGTANATFTGFFTVSEGDNLATANSQPTVSVTEGQSFTDQPVALFTDTNYPNNSTADFSAAINWGDGSSATTGTVSSDGSGNFTVSGSHTYSEDGHYTPTVTLIDNPATDNATGLATATAVAMSSADVAEADLSVTGSPISGTEGNSATFTVGTVSDPGSPDPGASFVGTINWGDGASSTGTAQGVTVSGTSGSYTVTGSHSYIDEGTFTGTVTVVETGVTGGTASSTFSATAAEGDVLNPTEGQPSVAPTEGTAFTGNVATFTDGGYPGNSSADFTATIDWGDGTTTGGTVTGGSGTDLTVSGSHSYADEGNFPLTVTLVDDGAGTANTTANNTAFVGEADTLAAATSQPPASVQEGDGATSQTVAVFTDAGYPNNTSADFAATIDWGDGTTTTGTVTGGSGSNLTVSGTHAYADEGSFTATTILTDVDDDESGQATASATATNVITATEADTLSATATPVSIAEGQSFSNVQVATFTTTYAGNVSTDFSAEILWGDGTSSAGTVGGPTGGPFTVTGDHFYNDEGQFTTTVRIHDNAPGTASTSAVGTATVAEADTLSLTANPVNIPEGQTFSGLIASFTDTGYPSNPDTDFNATINWGDGTSSSGLVVSQGGGSFNVSATGTHAYADEGSFTITVTVADNAPGTAVASNTATATVTDADSVNPASQTIAPTEGMEFNGTVLTFTDPGYPGQVASDFTADINWGDGGSSVGTVSGPTGGPFTISGTHVYTENGTFTVAVSFADPGGVGPVTADSTADVAEASITVTGATFSATEGALFSGEVGTFTNTDTAEPVSDYSVEVVWGDGTSSTGTAQGVSVTGSSGDFTVTGSHTYAEEGVDPTSVIVTDDAASTAPASFTGFGQASVANASLSVTASPVGATEGQTFSGQVATFSDAGGLEANSDYSASIQWGDGLVSTGTVSNGTVSGTHTYSEEGTYTTTVTVTDDPNTANAVTSSDSNTATVADASLSATAGAVSATEGATFSGVVASFTDSDPQGQPGDYTDTITWGDGSTSSGSIVANGSGGFNVVGSHTYTEEGNPTVAVTINDVGGASASTSFTATVANASLSVTADSISATEGASFSGQVATFTDAGGAEVFDGEGTDYTATIAWGDGTSSGGTITTTGGSLGVTGSHTYTEEGAATVTVTVTDDAGTTFSTSASGTAVITVANASLSVTATPVSATEGASFSGQVATFTDAGGLEADGDYSASIAWGDGSTTAGTVTEGTVTGSHVYSEEGTFTTVVTVTDDPNTANAISASASNTATVANASLSVTANSISATEGASFSGQVATFTDAGGAEGQGDYSVSIAWGDGTSSAGTVNNINGTLTVTGNHVYTEEGAATVTVSVTDDAGSSFSAAASGTAAITVANASLSVTGTPISATEGATFSGQVATFTDAGGAEVFDGEGTDYTATIVWGDGTSSGGTITTTGGSLGVTGSHTYTEEGAYTASVFVTDDAGSTLATSATGTAAAAVANASLSVTATPVSATEGASFSGQVATFTDAGGLEADGDYSASIAWGDGSTTAGTVTEGTVTGSHVYSEEGTFTTVVTVTDDPNTANAISASASNTATVANASLSVTANGISATEGASFNGQVATFTDAGGAEGQGDYSVSIAWGDGTSSAGTVNNINGTLTVTGNHVYTEEGAATVTVSVTDDAGSSFSAAASGTAAITVANASLSVTGTPISATEGATFSGQVATFTDAGGAEVFDGEGTDYIATIAWGDGTSSGGTITTTGGSLGVTGSHTYTEEGAYTASVVVTDDAGSTLATSATGTAAAAVANASLSVTATPVSATEGASFSGQVATFSDAGGLESGAGQYAATIDWGDGSTTAGTVSNGTVTGSHDYAEEGTYHVAVTVTDDPGSSLAAIASGSNTATVANASLSVTANSISATEGASFNGQVATFTDAGGAEGQGDYSVSIAWGDGTSSAGTVNNINGTLTVTGNHVYTEEGAATVTVSVTDDAGSSFSAAASGTAAITVANASLSVTGTPISATEGATFSGQVATFSDAGGAEVFDGEGTDYTATIAWGDGTSSGGTITTAGGSLGVTGSHTYTEEGAYTASVVVTDDAGSTLATSATGTAAAAVANASLSVTATPVSATEGASFSGQVATFSDAGGLEANSDYSASIAWGDGSTSAGTVSNGTVSGTHTYSEEGTYTTTVTVTDDPNTANAVSASNSAAATVADASLSATAGAVSATEGASFSGVVASFTDSDPQGQPGDYTDTITWGDGSTSSGSIVANGSGGFNVLGSHTYTEEGNPTVAVTIHDAGGASASTSFSASVANASLSVTADSISATEGATFSGQVATFSDAGGAEVFDGEGTDYTATIAWGDGTSSAGTITTTGGSLGVTGSHTYAEEGAATITVTVTDDPGSTLATSASGSAAIAVANASLTVNGTEVAATEGATFSGQVATVTDAGGAELGAGQYSANILWGDGDVSQGTVSNSSSGLVVSGSHVYSEEGTFTAVVTVIDDPNSASAVSASGNASVTVADASLTAAPGTVNATEGATFTGTVASFTDADPQGQGGDYRDTISWGDGTTSTGVLEANGAGGYNVQGSHAYAEEGSFTVSVTVRDVGGATASASTTATVADASLTAQGTNIAPEEGTTFNGSVANFTDADPNGMVSDYSATINWGDGTTTPGTVGGPAGGPFSVTGQHAYQDEGGFPITVTIHDAGGSSATAFSSATIANQPIGLQVVGLVLQEKVPQNNIAVASFTHGSGAEDPSRFSASINWGDGSPATPGTVVRGGNGSYVVIGSHTYQDEAHPLPAFLLRVDVSDGSVTASGTNLVIVLEAPLPPGTVGVTPATPRGNSDTRFLQEVFIDVFGVPPSAGQLNDLIKRFAHFKHSRVKLVGSLLSKSVLHTLHARAVQAGGGSSERALIDGYYRLFLDRPVDTVGLSTNLAKFRNGGGGERAVIIHVIALPEYYGKTIL